MKAYFLKARLILFSVILFLGFVMAGCKKETPPPQELTAKEKQFLSAPDAVTCELEKTKISKLDLPDGPVATNFFNDMDQLNRHFVNQGQITLANRQFKIILGFHPEREFYIYDTEKGFGPSWPGSESLYSYHKIDNKLYEFMLIENGRKIAARPYKGPLSTIKVDKGGRDLEKVKFSGSLKNEDNIAVPVGNININKENWPDMATECVIPVGNYTPSLYITYDNLLIRISENSSITPGRFNRKDIVYGIHVHQDKQYVLDFLNEPKIIFNQPPASQTSFPRGREIKFETVLIDPKLDILIRGLHDTSIKVNKEFKDRNGKVVHTTTLYKSLDPNVVISRADGEVVAEGVMPFG